jgi:Putative Flp pilus-assembly TadE/G-like
VGGRAGVDDDRGVVTAFVVIFAVALVFMCGLVLDGGRLLAAHRQARDVADSAARAGGQAISDPAVRAGDEVILDPDRAHDEACAFLARTPYPCSGGSTVHVDGNQVDVTVVGTFNPSMLPGGSSKVTEDGHACVAVGITVDETCGSV